MISELPVIGNLMRQLRTALGLWRLEPKLKLLLRKEMKEAARTEGLRSLSVRLPRRFIVRDKVICPSRFVGTAKTNRGKFHESAKAGRAAKDRKEAVRELLP